MAQFIIGLIVGLFAGSGIYAYVDAAMKEQARQRIEDEAELRVVEREAYGDEAQAMAQRDDYFNGFDPAPGFDPFCPAVCGNCAHWDSEVFAWGVCKICRTSGEMRRAEDVCNVRDGEVVR